MTGKQDYIMTNHQKKQHQETQSVFRFLREKSGLSQEQLAVALSVSTSTLRRWENRGLEPSMTKRQWRIFCDLLGTDFNELPDEIAVPTRASA
jgi:transcriptional regulator with XRE-family HTH domain